MNGRTLIAMFTATWFLLTNDVFLAWKLNAWVGKPVQLAMNLCRFRPALPYFPWSAAVIPKTLSERSRPTRSLSAWPPGDAATLDKLSDCPMPGRLSLSILSGRIIESIGTGKKNITISIGDSISPIFLEMVGFPLLIAQAAAATDGFTRQSPSPHIVPTYSLATVCSDNRQ